MSNSEAFVALIASFGCLATLSCLDDTSGRISNPPEAIDNAPDSDVLVSAQLNDTTVSSIAPANLNVEFFEAQGPRVTFGMNIADAPTISVVALADYAYFEAGTIEVNVAETLALNRANVILGGASQRSGRLRLELASKGRLLGALFDTDDRLTLDATVSFSCMVAPSLLPTAPLAPVPTSPVVGEVLVADSNLASSECQAALELLQL
jgi:hypothetical protein